MNDSSWRSVLRAAMIGLLAAALGACGGGDDPAAAAGGGGAGGGAGGSGSSGGSTATVALTALSGTQTYSLAYSATQIGIDQRPVTATFATDNGMNAYYASVNEALTIGTMGMSELSGSTLVQVGRWNNGQFGGVYFSAVNGTNNITLSAQQGWAYALAVPSPSVICSGSSSYALAGSTAVFQTDGAVAPGTLNNMSVVVSFNGTVSPSVQVSGDYTLNGANVSFSGNAPAQVGNSRMFRVNYTAGVNSGTVIGIFAGPAREEMGFIISTSAGAVAHRGAARLTRTADSSSCP